MGFAAPALSMGACACRAARSSIGSAAPLAHAAGFVQIRVLSLRIWHAHFEQRRQSASAALRGTGGGGAAGAAPNGATAPASVDGAAASHPPAPPLPHAQGSMELLLGPMFAGKTSALLRRVAEYEAAGLRVAVVKSDKDNRYCASHVVTHDGVRKSCFAVPSLAAFVEAAGPAYEGYQVVAVDEAQFFPDLADWALRAADHEAKHVVLAGLDGDFRRQRFGQVLDLLPLADCVTKLHATCIFCENEAAEAAGEALADARPSARPVRALFSLRIAADSRQEVVGGADKYAPACRRHYVELSGLRAAAAAAAQLESELEVGLKAAEELG